MDYNQITNELPRSSMLGFGCGSIMGRVGRRQSIRAIKQAFDAGITHFDVARSYGYGEAEACVGDALKNCREKVLIATKFGICPPKSNFFLKKIKPFVQSTIKTFPFTRQFFIKTTSIAKVHAVRQPFLADAAKRSVEKSLIELHTDYIDILFLHECCVADLTDEIIILLESLIKDGKVKAIGVATSIDDVIDIGKKYTEKFVFQFPNGLMHPNYKKLNAYNRPVITYSPFLRSNDLLSLAEKNKNELKKYELHVSDKASLYELMLLYAIESNKSGVVISSMLNGEHLSENMRILQKPKFSLEQLVAFSKIIHSSLFEV